ncbi:macrophage colony-stimulating factor 1 [Gracilinanus agilis]|uniref:macrophage colony-stimulating factor 1 n=1 Tax=Gracilinanus agilis TaxID=191870 RepID=UPI001CFD0E34|nr:macrophage colony-stimulating factor 1 [Gracilinanus agilis]
MTLRGAGGSCPFTTWLGSCLLLACLLVVWSFPTHGPETCNRLIGDDHIKILQDLIDSQMETSCDITYKFADQDQLNDSICYLKKAFPLIQDIFYEIIRFKDNSHNGKTSKQLHELYLRLRDDECVNRKHEKRDEVGASTCPVPPLFSSPSLCHQVAQARGRKEGEGRRPRIGEGKMECTNKRRRLGTDLPEQAISSRKRSFSGIQTCVKTFNNTPVKILEKIQHVFVETKRLLAEDWHKFDQDCTKDFDKCVSSDVVTKPDCNCLSPRTTPSSKLASVPHSSLSPSTAPVADLAWGDSEGTEGNPFQPSDLPPQTTAQGSARRRVPRSTCGSVESMETAGTLSASQSLVGSEMEPGSNKSPPDLSDSPRMKGFLNSALDTDSAIGDDASGDVSPGSRETEAPLFLLGGGPIQTGTADPDELLATPSTPVLAQGLLAQVRNDHLQDEGSKPLAGQARDYSSEEMDGGIQGLGSPTTQPLHSEETQGISSLPAQPGFPWGSPPPQEELEGKKRTRVRRSTAELEGGRGGQGLERDQGPGRAPKPFNSLPLTDTGLKRQNVGSPVLQSQGYVSYVLGSSILLVLIAVGGLLFYRQRQWNRHELQPAETPLEQPEISPLNQEEDRQVELPV